MITSICKGGWEREFLAEPITFSPPQNQDSVSTEEREMDIELATDNVSAADDIVGAQ